MTRIAETSLDFRSPNALWCSVLIETLVRRGVRQAVISPGSRSAPLTMALARHSAIEAIPVLDERSAGFFALGLAKQQRRAVALVCTSGTAGANYLPAVIEARETGVPLLVLTADRPPEMRDSHSGQTIDQQKLYGSHVNLFHECAVPEATLPMLRYLRQTVAHALERTIRPAAGPVHLNCPFRDPLVPVSGTKPPGIDPVALQGFFHGLDDCFGAGAAEGPVAGGSAWAGLLREPRGLIVVGANESSQPEEFARSIGRLSQALGWPVLADALSPVRHHAAVAGRVVAHYDVILRNEGLAEVLRPVRVLCVGGWPTSKVLRAWLQQADPTAVMLSERAANDDALHLRSTFVQGSVIHWAGGIGGRRRPGDYARQWLNADRSVRRALALAFKRAKGLIEPKWPVLLAGNLPRGTPCFIASSMPVRDAEYFWPLGGRGHRFFFSRGANGIDGTLSTALGVAHGHPRPAVLVTGDLALLHDTNGFLARTKFRGSLTIVLINNNGGGIFEHLPVAQFDPPFEDYFATPQNVDFGRLCATYGVTHQTVKNEAQLGRLVSTLPKRGIRVLEVRTSRKADAAFRKQLLARLAGS